MRDGGSSRTSATTPSSTFVRWFRQYRPRSLRYNFDAGELPGRRSPQRDDLCGFIKMARHARLPDLFGSSPRIGHTRIDRCDEPPARQAVRRPCIRDSHINSAQPSSRRRDAAPTRPKGHLAHAVRGSDRRPWKSPHREMRKRTRDLNDREQRRREPFATRRVTGGLRRNKKNVRESRLRSRDYRTGDSPCRSRAPCARCGSCWHSCTRASLSGRNAR